MKVKNIFNGFQKIGQVSDLFLVQKAKMGDKEAFGNLYLKYFDQIYRYIFFKVNQNHQEAEDITEMVFFKAWEHFEDFDVQQSGFQAWIYTIAHNKLIDFYKKATRQVQLVETIVDEKQNVEEKLTQDMEMDTVLKAVEKLPEDQKEVIVLKFVDGLSYSEISKVLGKKENAIRILQFRGLKKLQRILTENGKFE